MNPEPAILPLALVMIAGPQIISATFLATSERARPASVAYITGVTLAVTLGVTIAYYVARAAGAATNTANTSSGNSTVDLLIIALLLVLLVRVYLHRAHMKPPKWMARLQTSSPRFALGLGFLLFVAMPTDIITEITVGTFQAAHKAPWWHNLIFIGVTVFIVAIPLLLVLALGRRANVVLPKVRDWMTSHSWVVSELVILLFLGITLSNL
jgi:high-affinity Fe2+/Pb2+ permease